MARLGDVPVGRKYPVRIMGILNASPESFYKKSVSSARTQIRNAVQEMEESGADFVDVGGMSTAPYLSTRISEELESRRVIGAVKTIQDCSNLPISVDTCRAGVARDALECGVDIINDISGLKYDRRMPDAVSEFAPSLILCAYGAGTVRGGAVSATKRLLEQSLRIAEKSRVPSGRIAVDPAVGFFRRSGRGPFFTRTESDWVGRDLSILESLGSIAGNRPVLVSVSNKSFLGNILGGRDPADRLYGSIAAEAISVINGADIIRTHNVGAAMDAVAVASRMSKKRKGL